MPFGSLIDLHLHSTGSDGSLSPGQILALANESGIKTISITDHDSIDGIKTILANPLPDTPEIITGVELSCDAPSAYRSADSIHLLGYGFSIYDKQLNNLLDKAQSSRAARNPEIIQKLNQIGFKITMEQVEKRFGAKQTGRPHIAELMKEMGYVNSFQQAFDKYLGKGRPAYVDKYKISCKDAIETILNAGGVPVLAHPGLLAFPDKKTLASFVGVLKEYGLQGLEIYYTDHDEKMMTYLETLAAQNDLLITGGSDFHGRFNPGVEPGVGKGNLNISSALVSKLKARLEELKDIYWDLGILERNIHYHFNDKSLLNNALCHRSYLNENQDKCNTDNERLEFLGDAVLGVCIGHFLMKKSPSRKEGELSRLRSNLVSEPALAQMARRIDLGRFIHLGKGEANARGYEKNSILSDTFEAVIAAVYLDAGFDEVYHLIRNLFEERVLKILSKDKIIDYKSLLQEYLQAQGAAAPQYIVRNETGPDHDKTFEISLNLFGDEFHGQGKIKKAAEQASAKKALEKLKKLSI